MPLIMDVYTLKKIRKIPNFSYLYIFLSDFCLDEGVSGAFLDRIQVSL